MIFIADYLAIGLVFALFLFYLDSQHYLDRTDKLFVASLLFTGLTALIDIITGLLLQRSNVPLWLNMGANTLYFVINILTTSIIALFLFRRILEHVTDQHCMKNACVGLTILLSIYSVFVISNFWNGCLFYFDEAGNYCRGPHNVVGYVITGCQMILVIICYLRNRKNATRSMRRIIIQTFPIVLICMIIQRTNPEIMMNGIIMALVNIILFLSFQGQHQGVHNLTKLNDRHRFFHDIEYRIKKKYKFQVFLISIKNFRMINQKYGHLTGNEILYQFAFSLEKLIPSSIAFHMNGTVFALTIPYMNQRVTEENCGLVLDFLENQIRFKDEPLKFEYVVAEYISNNNDSDAAQLYEKLEYAIAVAHQKNNHYIRYNPNLGKEMHRKRYLIERMQNIHKDYGFEVWYQPIHCLHDKRFGSMEALVRLREPDGTLISPAEFVPLAEETGAVYSITWFVVENVCAFLNAHPELDWISVSINIPMNQLLERGFAVRLNNIVNNAGIDHSRICLEFTERDILDNFEKTQELMHQLNEDGYRFYLDDFGTGYSNFQRILQLPFQAIKLDSTLTRTSKNDRLVQPVVGTLTSLFHNMGFDVIAEGAESIEDTEFLFTQGVDRIQGFYYARPMDEAHILEFYNS